MTTAYRMLSHHSKGIGDSGFKVVLNLSHKLATAGQETRIVEGAGPGHQFERGTRIAPLPANVRASCNARFLVDAPGTARRLELLSKGNCRTIAPSSDWTSKDAARSMIFMGA